MPTPHDAVEQLAATVGWSGQGNDVDWSHVEAAWGTPLPPDFRLYTMRFPSGVYQDFVHVYSPTHNHPGMDADLIGIQGILRHARQWYPANSPLDVYPAPGGLLPWASSGTDWAFCWDTTQSDPGRWPVVACSLDFDPTYRFRGSMTDFLLALVTGRTGFTELQYMTERDLGDRVVPQPPIFTPLTT